MRSELLESIAEAGEGGFRRRCAFSRAGRNELTPGFHRNPCKNILLAALDYSNNEAEVTYSGTSFSAPMVAGLAARFLASNSTATPIAIWDRIRNEATNDIIVNTNGMPNRLVYWMPTAEFGVRKV